jgi:hypothetical protein
MQNHVNTKKKIGKPEAVEDSRVEPATSSLGTPTANQLLLEVPAALFNTKGKHGKLTSK